MKRQLIILALVVVSNAVALAGNPFSATLSSGTMLPNSKSFRMGFGILGSLSYSVWEQVDISLSAGYMAWGFGIPEDYNTSIVPVLLGVRYFFSRNGFSPYVSGDVAYSAGEFSWVRHEGPGGRLEPSSDNVVTGTERISEVVPDLGMGFQVPLTWGANLDVGTAISLTARNRAAMNLRLMVGINFPL